jgi:hypothetical protein
MRTGCLQSLQVYYRSDIVCNRLRAGFQQVDLCERSFLTRTDAYGLNHALSLQVKFKSK